jgi:hypothetical protein
MSLREIWFDIFLSPMWGGFLDLGNAMEICLVDGK